MSDVLYILGRGSKQDDLELRLSLRSLEKYAQNLDRVFIVGNCPEWVKNVTHIPEEDKYFPFSNHVRKVLKAIDGGISDNFLLMNDDFFMMRSFDVDTYPYYIRGEMFSDKQGGSYRQMLNNTVEILNKKGIDKVLAYNCHVPIIYNRQKFLELKPLWERWKEDTIGFSPRIVYGNLFVKDGVFIQDPKIFDDKMPSEVGLSGCISSHSNSVNVLKELEQIFKEPSKYERNEDDVQERERSIRTY
jgi:hypothetical protein